MDEDFRMVNELTLSTSNIKKEVCVVFFFNFFFFNLNFKHEKKNM
jgi:hypothetical protein